MSMAAAGAVATALAATADEVESDPHPCKDTADRPDDCSRNLEKYKGCSTMEENACDADYGKCSASSIYSTDAIGHRHGKGALGSTQAWSAAANSVGQWWQMDIGEVNMVAGVVTQGRNGHDQYVTSYKVQVSQDDVINDESEWEDVDNGKVFTANTASNSDKVQNLFLSPVNARYVRIVVQTWNVHVSMRAAVLLCKKGNLGPGFMQFWTDFHKQARKNLFINKDCVSVYLASDPFWGDRTEARLPGNRIPKGVEGDPHVGPNPLVLDKSYKVIKHFIKSGWESTCTISELKDCENCADQCGGTCSNAACKPHCKVDWEYCRKKPFLSVCRKHDPDMKIALTGVFNYKATGEFHGWTNGGQLIDGALTATQTKVEVCSLGKSGYKCASEKEQDITGLTFNCHTHYTGNQKAECEAIVASISWNSTDTANQHAVIKGISKGGRPKAHGGLTDAPFHQAFLDFVQSGASAAIQMY